LRAAFEELLGLARRDQLIGRIWHGWTAHADADAYEELLRTEVLPAIGALAGSRGAYLLRCPLESETEFVTITLFESLEAVKAFAGDDYEQAVVPPAARKLLTRFDERSAHYETVLEPG
jgi:heme-degrading monooxygenase HmoA